MSHCIRCHAGNVRPSRPKWGWEALRHQLTHHSIYRCDRCGWRGWGLDWTDAMTAPADIVVENVPEDFFTEPVQAAAPAGSDDLDFHVLNIPRKPARELRMR
jgi:hypothetical protein